ncbi:MAG TPA: ABC transporter substrate-binding protein [Syntrophobacteria bacterium]|nr:ABC transporter substrate-binding protein [Syntrophobacteria bacterium]
MKRMTLLLVVLVAALLTLVGSGPAAAQQKPFVLNMAWQPENETFAAWYAAQKGWDKEEGLEFKLHYFDSGMAQLEALPAKQWVFAGMGGVPATVGALRFGTYLFALGNDESVTNAVMVRANSPIMQAKGFNPKFPEVFGKPDLLKGKTFLVTTVSSGHFAMSKYLEVFGLKDSDVVVKNMDQAQAVAAFESGIGDAVVLWAPHLYTGLNKGWKVAGNTKTSGWAQPIVIIGEKEFCDKNPEIVAKFLRVYLRGINALKKEGVKLLPEYKKFYKDWAGLDMSDKMCELDITMHPLFTLEDQIKLFDASKGPSQVEIWQRAILDFFTAQGRFKPEEKEKVLKSNYITDKFLKQVKTPIP